MSCTTSKDRRKVAERLRVYSHDFDFGSSDPFWYVSKAAFGDVDVHTYHSVFARLADLIDRPVIKPEPSGRAYWRCPRCGAFNSRSAVTDCCSVIPAHYCANCGAEVGR